MQTDESCITFVLTFGAFYLLVLVWDSLLEAAFCKNFALELNNEGSHVLW